MSAGSGKQKVSPPHPTAGLSAHDPRRFISCRNRPVPQPPVPRHRRVPLRAHLPPPVRSPLRPKQWRVPMPAIFKRFVAANPLGFPPGPAAEVVASISDRHMGTRECAPTRRRPLPSSGQALTADTVTPDHTSVQRLGHRVAPGGESTCSQRKELPRKPVEFQTARVEFSSRVGTAASW
jgi:hypothetical protein